MIFHRAKRSMRSRNWFAWWMQNFFRSIWMLKDMRSENMWRCILKWILRCILSWIRDWIRSWIRSWIWSKWSCKWNCKWKRVRREMNLKKSHERERRWWLKINLLVFFSRQRDQILLDIERKSFEINAQYFIIKDLISAYEMMWDECVMLISIEISSAISSEIDTVISLALMQCLQSCQFLCRLILTMSTFFQFFLQLDDNRRHFFDDSNDEILRNFSSIVRANSYRRLTVKLFLSCSTRYKRTSWIDWKKLFNIEMFFSFDLMKFHIIIVLTLIRWHAKIFAFANFRAFFFMFILWLMKWKAFSSYAIDSELNWRDIKIWKITFFSYIILTFNR